MRPWRSRRGSRCGAWGRLCRLTRSDKRLTLAGQRQTRPVLSVGALPWPKNWLELLNRPLNEREFATLQQCVERGQSYGSEFWVKQTAGQLGLACTWRPRGRPKKRENKGS